MAAVAVVVAGCGGRGPTTPSCSYAWTPSSQAVTAGGGSFQAAVTTAATCTWTAAANAAWVTLETTSGTGPGPVAFRVAANDATSPRAATLTVQGQGFEIRQEAAPQAQSCAFEVWPDTVSFGPAGGSAPMAVTGPEGCRWTATTADTWLTLAGASGSGAGPMILTATANPGAAPRTGSVQVGNERVSVVQAGAGCDFDVSPTSRAVGAAGGRFDVAVETSAGCDWQAASTVAWLTVSASRGTGAGRVTIDVAALGGAGTRSGSVRIAGATVTVTQSAAPAGCTYAVAPQTIAAPAASGSFIVNVSTAAGCAWTASSNASWVTIPLGQSGAGPGPVGLLVAANPSTAPRTAVVQVGGQTVTITQAGAAPPCTYSVTPSTQAVSISGGQFQVAVSTASTCQWTATTSVPWMTITAGAQGTGPGTVVYVVATNGSQMVRTGALTIGGQSVVVTQQ